MRQSARQYVAPENVSIPRRLICNLLSRNIVCSYGPGVHPTLTTTVKITDRTNGRNAYIPFSAFHVFSSRLHITVRLCGTRFCRNRVFQLTMTARGGPDALFGLLEWRALHAKSPHENRVACMLYARWWQMTCTCAGLRGCNLSTPKTPFMRVSSKHTVTSY